jgi:hypothetical protein
VVSGRVAVVALVTAPEGCDELRDDWTGDVAPSRRLRMNGE